MLLELEIAAARAVGALSRLAGRGGGTTLPGKLLTALDSEALGRLARALPQGVALVSATNGKTTTTAMTAEILGETARLAHNRAGANLVSGIASTLVEERGAELGLFEVDEGALPDVARMMQPRLVCLGNLFRDQLDRYGELEIVAERWAAALERLPAASRVIVNADDPVLAGLAELRPAVVRFGLDDPTAGRERPSHAADSKYCRRCGSPLVYTAAYVGHLGDYRCPSCGAARRRSMSSPGPCRTTGSTARRSISTRPPGSDGSRSACPASTTSTTPPQRPRSPSSWARRSTRSPPGSPVFSRPSDGSSGSRPTAARR